MKIQRIILVLAISLSLGSYGACQDRADGTDDDPSSPKQISELDRK